MLNKHIVEIKKLIYSTKLLILEVLVVATIADFIFINSIYSTVVIVLSVLFWIVIVTYNLSTKYIGLVNLILICALPFLLMLELEIHAEKVAVWAYITLIVYTFRQFIFTDSSSNNKL